MLKVKNLTKIYGNSRRNGVLAVDKINFEVGRNEIVGFLGPNGAGKTTTIKCIASLVVPTAGDISIDGFNLYKERGKALRRISAQEKS